MELSQNLKLAIDACLLAGKKILEIYTSHDFIVEYKSDESPLTLADKSSDEIIKNALRVSNIPILSEEGNVLDYNKRKGLKQLWIVDPLDGTKEFIKKNNEFTVNIALVENNRPNLGVIYAPALKVLYFSEEKFGSYKLELKTSTLSTLDYSSAIKLPLIMNKNNYGVVISRSHLNKETLSYIEKLKKTRSKVESVPVGSSLKFCLLAEGTADCYPRFSPCMEWDTAAGQIICKEAGFVLIDQITNTQMLYNRENLLNNSFIVK
ncbi:3'(2'),5'-bisphosphate nucleotidase CysQ [Flavobacteriaceae bacterium]|nr:3'(2'),5'-bisphosphate nucleotidase CysQ [Flavobacteriaceae bacterium]